MKGQRLLLREVLIKEQVLLSISEEIAVWLKERNPDELGRLADEYALARQSDKGRLRGTEDYIVVDLYQ